MSSEIFSLIVWYQHDPQINATRLRVIRVDTGEEVHLSNGTLVVRVLEDTTIPVTRCLIRHVASGREISIQSGHGMRSFVTNYLLSDDNVPGPPDSGKAEG